MANQFEPVSADSLEGAFSRLKPSVSKPEGLYDSVVNDALESMENTQTIYDKATKGDPLGLEESYQYLNAMRDKGKVQEVKPGTAPVPEPKSRYQQWIDSRKAEKEVEATQPIQKEETLTPAVSPSPSPQGLESSSNFVPEVEQTPSMFGMNEFSGKAMFAKNLGDVDEGQVEERQKSYDNFVKVLDGNLELDGMSDEEVKEKVKSAYTGMLGVDFNATTEYYVTNMYGQKVKSQSADEHFKDWSSTIIEDLGVMAADPSGTLNGIMQSGLSMAPFVVGAVPAIATGINTMINQVVLGGVDRLNLEEVYESAGKTMKEVHEFKIGDQKLFPQVFKSTPGYEAVNHAIGQTVGYAGQALPGWADANIEDPNIRGLVKFFATGTDLALFGGALHGLKKTTSKNVYELDAKNTQLPKPVLGAPTITEKLFLQGKLIVDKVGELYVKANETAINIVEKVKYATEAKKRNPNLTDKEVTTGEWGWRSSVAQEMYELDRAVAVAQLNGDLKIAAKKYAKEFGDYIDLVEYSNFMNQEVEAIKKSKPKKVKKVTPKKVEPKVVEEDVDTAKVVEPKTAPIDVELEASIKGLEHQIEVKRTAGDNVKGLEEQLNFLYKKARKDEKVAEAKSEPVVETPEVEPVEPTTMIEKDLHTPEELKGSDSPFFQSKDENVAFQQLFKKADVGDIDILFEKLITDANAWLHGNEKADIDYVRGKLSKLVQKIDTFKEDFEGNDESWNAFKQTVEEGNAWVAGLDRPKIKRSGTVSETKLNDFFSAVGSEVGKIAKSLIVKEDTIDNIKRNLKDNGKIDPSKLHPVSRYFRSISPEGTDIKYMGSKRKPRVVWVDKDSKIVKSEDLIRNYNLWKNTGMWFDRQGWIRVELPEVRINPIDEVSMPKGGEVPISVIVDSPELFNRFPELSEYKVRENKSLNSEGRLYKKFIEVRDLGSGNISDVIIHELTHATEEVVRSDFRGTNPAYEAVKNVVDNSQMIRDTFDKYTTGDLNTEAMADAVIKAGKEAYDYYKKAMKAKDITFSQAKAGVIEDAVHNFIDRSGNIKRSLFVIGPDGQKAVQAMTLAYGSHPMATWKIKQLYKEIRGVGLSRHDIREHLNPYIRSNRTVSIAKSGKKYNFPEGAGPSQSLAHMANFRNLHGVSESKFQQVIKATEIYHRYMREAVEDLYEEGLIDQKKRDSLIKHDYEKTTIAENFDNARSVKVGGKTIEVTDSGIETLQSGKKVDMLEIDSEILALETFSRIYGRIANNRANKSLVDLAQKFPDNELARLANEKGSKKLPAIPAGWIKLHYYEDGVRKKLFISPAMSKEWLSKDVQMHERTSKVLRFISGAPILRTMATGVDWGFAVAQLPMDVLNAWFATRIYDSAKGDWESVYSPNTPIYAYQMTKGVAAVAKDAITRKGWYEDFMRYGGGLNLLSIQGRLMKRGGRIRGKYIPKRLGDATSQALEVISDIVTYPIETAELATRLAIMREAVSIKAKGMGITLEEARKDKAIMEEAAYTARDYMDFSQGGSVVKAIDQFYPYTAAAITGTRTFLRAFKPGNGMSLESSYKLAQFAGFVAANYIAAQAFSPKTMKELEGDQVKQNNFIIPLRDISIKDEYGEDRYLYLKLPCAHEMRGPKFMFENIVAKQRGERVDVEGMVKAFGQTSPVTGGSDILPPTGNALLGYLTNTDLRFMERIVHEPGPFEFPESGKESIPGRTPQAFTDVGKVTGLSPERLKYATDQMITRDSMWSALFNASYDKALGEDVSLREMSLAEKMAKTPVIKRFFGLTNPSRKYQSDFKDMSETERLETWSYNTRFDNIVKGAVFNDTHTDKDVMKFLDGVEDPNMYDKLYDRYLFAQASKEVPNRSFWLGLRQFTMPETRARMLYKQYEKSSSVEKKQWDNELAIVEDIEKAKEFKGSGFNIISPRFNDEFDRLVAGEDR